MKNYVTRFGLIAFALLSSVLGIPGQARAAEGEGCDGFPKHHTIVLGDRLWNLSKMFYGVHERWDIIAAQNGVDPYKLRVGDDLNIPCPADYTSALEEVDGHIKKYLTKFDAHVEPPASLPVASSELVPVAAEAASLSLTSFTPQAESASRPVPVAVVLEAEPVIQPAQSAPPVIPVATLAVSATLTKRSGKKVSYEVVRYVPSAEARAKGIVPGTFPALLLINQTQKGDWKKRHKMVATVEEIGGDYRCTIILRRSPPKNSAVAIDFENGNSILITSDLLLEGDPSDRPVPKEAAKRTYSALRAAYPIKASVAMMALRFALPTGLQMGPAMFIPGPFGVPLGVVTTPISLLGSYAMKKIGDKRHELEAERHPSLHVEYAIAGQQDAIDKLQDEVATLKKQIDSLGQTETKVRLASVKEAQ